MAAVVDEIRHCLIVSGRRGGLLVVVTGRQTALLVACLFQFCR